MPSPGSPFVFLQVSRFENVFSLGFPGWKYLPPGRLGAGSWRSHSHRGERNLRRRPENIFFIFRRWYFSPSDRFVLLSISFDIVVFFCRRSWDLVTQDPWSSRVWQRWLWVPGECQVTGARWLWVPGARWLWVSGECLGNLRIAYLRKCLLVSNPEGGISECIKHQDYMFWTIHGKYIRILRRSLFFIPFVKFGPSLTRP